MPVPSDQSLGRKGRIENSAFPALNNNKTIFICPMRSSRSWKTDFVRADRSGMLSKACFARVIPWLESTNWKRVGESWIARAGSAVLRSEHAKKSYHSELEFHMFLWRESHPGPIHGGGKVNPETVA
jgi:hypothetical protein